MNKPPLSDHGIPMSTSVSKQLTNIDNVINPHDLYPLNSRKANCRAVGPLPTAIGPLMAPQSSATATGQYAKANVHTFPNRDSRFEGSLTYSAKENAHKTAAHINKRNTNSRSSRNCHSSSSNRFKPHLLADNSGASLPGQHCDGPLRVQYQSELRASTRSERVRAADNNNCVYNNNFRQLYNSNQNINNLHVSMLHLAYLHCNTTCCHCH